MRIIRGLSKLAVIFSALIHSCLVAEHPTMLGPQLAGNGSGVVAIWSSFNGAEFAIYQAKLPLSGSWSSPAKISSSSTNCLYPSLAMNSAGDILSSWQKASGAIPDIQLAVNTFSDITSTIITTASFFGSEHLSCGAPISRLDNAGNGTVIWEGRSSTGYLMLGTECTTSNLRAPVVTLSGINPQHVNADLVVQIPSGTSFVVWQEPINGLQTIKAASLTIDAELIGPVAISSSANSSSRPYLSLSSNGNVYAAWWENSNPYSTIVTTAISNSLDVSTSTISLENVSLIGPRIGANASGDILLVATAILSNGNTAVATAVKSGETWGGCTILSDPSTTSVAAPIVHLNDLGQGVALWQDTSSANGIIWGAIYNSGSWGAPTQLSSPLLNCSAPALYVDPSGYAVAAWIAESNTEGTAFSTQSSTLVSFLDSWSTPTTISTP
ncbi:hypothetical protein E6Q11_05725 [Candidatus Dojkabacteria bacterium]|uniref:Exo-alpha-sialidase n=1 Tax=Candidatus Dojkabacteria bacterium TaxID=2099670 RepID=A0A5C7J385_9BACT|nr:MAG: hypothetical protein E6Q11_05725 [Candidatus Dojkabacteria bacterium]